MKTLPNLLVIGAMKCGTSSLHRYLGLHPEIAMSRSKELNFFLPPESGQDGGAGDLLLERSSCDRGIDWYAQQFEPAPIRGESSVAYSFPWFEKVADDAARALGGDSGPTRLIYVVRDPIERMLSHHRQFAARDRRPVAEALLDPDGPYLRASSYATALAPFIESFGRDSLLVLDQARLRDDRERAMAEAFTFLGVDPDFSSPQMASESNVSSGKGPVFRTVERLRSSGPGSAVASRLPKRIRHSAERALRRDSGESGNGVSSLEPAQRARLAEMLEPEIAGLERITGWDLAGWRASPRPR